MKMIFKNINILDENFEIMEGGYLATESGKISYVGEKKPNEKFDREIEGRGKLIIPGFVNSHCHLPMSLLRGYGESMNLQDWLFTKIFPFEEHLNGEAIYYGTLLSLAEAIKFGITSTSDMYYFMDEIAQAVTESGAKANISRSVSHFDNSDFMSSFRAKEMIDAYEKYHDTADGRLKVDMSLHSEYTTTPIAVRQLAEYTKTINGRVQVHVSETEKEVKECIQRHGMTPVEYLNFHGVFDVPTTAAHCVWLQNGDYDILKEKNVTVASNPISNLKLASGVCNLGKLLDRGINVAIGTDGVASNNNLNFVEEMKIFAISSKMMYNTPEKVTPIDTLKAATINGAIAQGRMSTGLIKEGYCADLVVMDIDKPYMKPVHSVQNNLVYSSVGNDVEMTIVDGNILYEKGEYKTIDIEKITFKAEEITKEILAKI